MTQTFEILLWAGAILAALFLLIRVVKAILVPDVGRITWQYRGWSYRMFFNPIREIGRLRIFLRSFILYCQSGPVWRGPSYATFT